MIFRNKIRHDFFWEIRLTWDRAQAKIMGSDPAPLYWSSTFKCRHIIILHEAHVNKQQRNRESQAQSPAWPNHISIAIATTTKTAESWVSNPEFWSSSLIHLLIFSHRRNQYCWKNHYCLHRSWLIVQTKP